DARPGDRGAEEASPEADALAALQGEERERRADLADRQSRRIEAEKALVEAQAALREAETALQRLREAMAGDDLTIDGEGRVAPLDGAAAPSSAAAADPAESDADLRRRVETLRGRLRWLGRVNPEAAEEYEQIRVRHEELTAQIADLEGAERRMLAAEAELAALIQERFATACRRVDAEFQRYFQLMFRGGSARLRLSDEEDPEASGLELEAQPPGKRVDDLAMLSGGERSLTAIALLFALLEVRPAPFCVLDEVDAALDEANVGRFVGALKALAERTQFVVITHNRRTIEQADSIYGITMGEDSVSRVLSVRLADLELDD
ncbi:MAG: AAA family ATPase, partial [Chloroflexi bacterium]|nr:AAA family ATPase [Chloroflexota bacterium]